jgi:autotransporter-associated beta strand protein
VQTITRTFNVGAHYVYNGTDAQATGTGLPATVNNLTINNSAGVSLSGNVTVNGTLTLTSGALSIGANTLTLNGPAIAGTPGNLTTTLSSSLVFGGSSASVTIPSGVNQLNNLTIGNTSASGVTLNGPLTVNGALTINASSLLADGGHTLAAKGAVANSGTHSGAGKVSLAGGAAAHTLSGNGTFARVGLDDAYGATVTGSLTFGDVVSGTGPLTVNGAGITVTLAGLNTFSGALTVQNGTLSVPTINEAGADGPLGSSAAAVVLGGSGTTGTLRYTGTGATPSSTRTFTLATGGTGTFQIDNAGTALTLNGLIGGSGALTKTGGGTLALPAANTFSGLLTVSAGTLLVPTINNAGANGPLGSGSGAVVLGGTLAYTGDTAASSRTFTMSGSAGTFRIDAAATVLTLSGAIGGSGVLTKTGSGTLALTAANTFSGGTVISAGTVQITGVAASGNQNLGTGGITFANGGRLLNTGSGLQTTAKAITLNSGGGVIAMQGPTMTLTGTISGGGGLTTGGSDLILTPSAANNIGIMTVNSGRLFVGNVNAIANSAVLHIDSGATLDFQYSATPLNTMTFASGSCLANRVGTLTVNTASVTFPTAGTMIFNQDDLATSPITVNGAYPARTGDLTFQLGGSSTSVGTVTLSGAISGNFGLIKTLPGTLVLSGTGNSFSGGTTVTGGTLEVQKDSGLGSGSVTVASGATLQLDSGTTHNYINDGATVFINGTGKINLFAAADDDRVAALYINGVRQAAGTWGASGADHIDTAHFAGSGTLVVGTVVTFTSSGTWTAPAGVTNITVELWGGGGAGGGVTTSGAEGAGGAGGQYAKKVVGVTPGTGYAIVVPGTTAGTTGNGSAGGDATFGGTTAVAKGGAGGGANNGDPGLGSTASGVGDLVYAGGNGGADTASASGAGGGGAGSTGSGGNASGTTAGTGTSEYGGNGGAGWPSGGAPGEESNGNAGSNYGGGGGGAITDDTSDYSGGSGAPGYARITYKVSATVTLSDLTQTYTGSPLTPTATTEPAGLTINWTSAPQTAAGTYTVTATINDSVYQGSASDTFTINPAPLTVTATGPAKTYGTALTAGTSTANFTHSGEVNGEAVTSVTLTPDAAGLSAATAAGDAYVVTPSLATGSGGFLAANYNITYNPYNGTVALADFRSVTSGDWNIAATWQRDDGSDWVAASSSPSNTDGTITILNAHTVTVTQAVSVDQVVVAAGGQVTVNSGVTWTVLGDAGVNLMLAGRLLVNGSVAASPLVVGNGAVLGGTNTITGNVTAQSGGIVAPGASIGTLTVTNGNVTLESNSTFRVEYGISPDCDKLDLSKSGALVLEGATLDLVGEGLSGDRYTIVRNATNIVGTFKDLTNCAPVPGNAGYFIHYVTDRTELGYGSYILINKNPSPTSSGIDLRAYQGADGVYVEFVAYDVEDGSGTVRLAVLGADGKEVWSGETNVLAGARYVCRFLVPGLAVGGTYNFVVRDEVGKGWSAPGVTVMPFAAKMVSLSLTGVTLSFDSLPEREYEIQWVARLGDVWQTVTTVVADSDRTSAFVAYPDPKAPSGFFRVRVK